MEGRNKKMELLGNAPIPKALLVVGLPAMIGVVINTLYDLVNAHFVGGLGTSQMGAISVALPLGQVVVGLGLLPGNGGASYISRLLGRGNKEAADRAASTTLYNSIFVGAAAILCAVIFLRPLLKCLGTTGSILPYAITYAGIYVVSSIFNMFNVTMNNIVTSEGTARATVCVLLTGAAFNMVPDPVFIYVLKLGAAGATIATAISQTVPTLIYLYYVISGRNMFNLHFRNCYFSNEIMSEILKIGIPTLAFQLLTSLSVIMTSMQAKPYGDSVIVGMGAVTRMISLGSLMVFGFIKGFQPIAGYNYGAGNYERLREAIRISVVWSTLFCAVFGLTMAVFSDPVIPRFTKSDMEMTRIGQETLKANGLSSLLFGFYIVYSSLFLTLGKAGEGFVLGVCRQGICFVPIILIFPALWGLNGTLYAQPAVDVPSAMTALFMAAYLNRDIGRKGKGGFGMNSGIR